jgi:hypothetical protein
MVSTEVVSIIIAVITAAGTIFAALIGRPRRDNQVAQAGAGVQVQPPDPPSPEPMGLLAFISALAFVCASIVVGLALALGKPPSVPLMLPLGAVGGLLAGVAGQRAYYTVRRSRAGDRTMTGYEVMLTAFFAFTAILIVG